MKRFRDTWHYKLNKHFFNEDKHWMERSWEPRHKDFCSYWWATITRLAVALVLVVFTIATVWFVGNVVYMYPIDSLITVGSIVLFFAAAIAAIIVSEKLGEMRAARRKTEQPKSTSLFVQRYRAYKERICPMIEYD